jgi:hypothetical protein
MIPNTIHFIYPVTERTRPWSLVNHAAIMLARKHHPNDKIIVWANKPNSSFKMRLSADLADARIEFIDLPTQIEGVEIEHPQYMSDVLRLQILYAHGGVYMDTDMLLRTDVDDLRDIAQNHNRLVLSYENEDRSSICNALMVTPAENAFISAWLDAMPDALRSTTWGNGGVVLPVELSKRQGLIDTRVILNYKLACSLDLSRPWLFDPALREEAIARVGNATAIHVFETYWRDTVKHVDWGWVDRTPCLFSDILGELDRRGDHED